MIEIIKTPTYIGIIIFEKNHPLQRSCCEISKIDDTTWYFNRLFVHPKSRGKGYAHQMLGELIKILDAENIRLNCAINSYGDLNHDALKKLYFKYGFKGDITGENELIRYPQNINEKVENDE